MASKSSGKQPKKNVDANLNPFSLLLELSGDGDDLESDILRAAVLRAEITGDLPEVAISPRRKADAKTNAPKLLMRSYKPGFYSNLRAPGFIGPEEIGSFSLKADGNLVFDRSQLKTISAKLNLEHISTSAAAEGMLSLAKPQPFTFNLAKDFHSWFSARESVKPLFLAPLLQWILHNREELLSQQNPADADVLPSLADCCGGAEFVCMRPTLTSIAGSLYSPNQLWTVNVIRWQNVFFLLSKSNVALPNAGQNQNAGLAAAPVRNRGWPKTSRNHNGGHSAGGGRGGGGGAKRAPYNRAPNVNDAKLMNYCGIKFEQLATGSSSAAEHFCAVVQSVLRGMQTHKLLIAGKIDCQDASEDYVEVASRRVVENDKDLRSIYLKLFDYWLSCYFMGVPKLVLGFHALGDLRGVAEMSIAELPELAATIRPPNASLWEPSICLNFLDSFLTALKAQIPENDLSAVYQVKYAPDSDQPRHVPQDVEITIRRMKNSEFENEKFFEFFRLSFAPQFT